MGGWLKSENTIEGGSDAQRGSAPRQSGLLKIIFIRCNRFFLNGLSMGNPIYKVPEFTDTGDREKELFAFSLVGYRDFRFF